MSRLASTKALSASSADVESIAVGADPLGCCNGRAPGKSAEAREHPSFGIG